MMKELNSNKIQYSIDGPLFIIKLNCPRSLNALGGIDYIYLATLLEKAEKTPEIYFTVLQSTGRYFSSGADFGSISKANELNEPPLLLWLDNFLSRNTFVTDKFAKHSKILVCCLNGPAIGFSAALVALCDIVYSMNDKVFLLCPFANLGLVTEGGTCITLPLKLGNNLAFEKLMFSEPITFDDLKGKIINKNYNLQDVNEFNMCVLKYLKDKIEKLYLPSLTNMKNLIQNTTAQLLSSANSNEVNEAMKYWVDGEPPRRFVELKSKKRTNKM
ncbi:hypothetical protein TBLA_0E01080 [Henningerozyma blattae CBS 6284]|uniref:3-hydroxyisobutyryl-coenzyme A hydrolase n=1 Tax=Henningerozyma blattae (strain ATCC 34711 / CBS 6284 / DSM 70876 / NBRC 10599 / NRRL Y-10934 / UCD 77-7) TaxID=1071380 RepID=I2H466_HENB6|nr:hypothetical protein TBLA_0E01080 [Tetrapisispora blattae CBS 6284]CCH61168.1 hypothetical protein TBLA_0E01080 [Tetrapisispora blattae CBS 6284]